MNQQFESLRDMGISIEVFSGGDRLLTDASNFMPMPMHEVVAQAQLSAESEDDAAFVSVSVDLGDDLGWQTVWSASYDHEHECWPWQRDTDRQLVADAVKAATGMNIPQLPDADNPWADGGNGPDEGY